MEKLIEALQIFLKYGNPEYPTHCEYDILHVQIDPDIVSSEDRDTLNTMGFFVDKELGCFLSFRYGSA